MRKGMLCLALIAASLGPLTARAQTSCADPGKTWGRAAPWQVGLDGALLRKAINFATTRVSANVKVFRHGCLVAEDLLSPLTDEVPFESFSVAKSVTSMVIGRAVTLGFLSLSDTVGTWITEADGPHGALTLRQLLQQSHGLHWNFVRDYNAGKPDLVADALALPFDHEPGTYFEYHQEAVSLAAEVANRAVKAHGFTDFQDFTQRQLFGRIGIAPGSWSWGRDRAGHTAGFYALRMRVKDYARLGQLMLRRGVWKGTQLITDAYITDATTPSPTNPCYGLYFWLNADPPEGRGCINPTIYARDERPHRFVPPAPADGYALAGFLDQRIYVLPGLDMVIVRWGITGSREPDTRSLVWTSAPGEFEWEWARRWVRAVKDVPVPPDPGPYHSEQVVPVVDPDYGIAHSATETDDVIASFTGPS